MKVYVNANFADSDFHCHTTNPNGLFTEIDDPFFDGKCKTFIEGIRYVPEGKNWTREDGRTFCGKMITSWKPYSELDDAQREYERQLIAEYEATLAESVRLSDLDAAYQEGVNAAYDR